MRLGETPVSQRGFLFGTSVCAWILSWIALYDGAAAKGLA